MPKRTVTIYPASAKEMEALGQRLKDARLRRRFSMETVCARAQEMAGKGAGGLREFQRHISDSWR